MLYQRCADSSIHLPQLSLSLSGLGDLSPDEGERILSHSLEQGICHWDLCPSSPQEEEALFLRTADYIKSSFYREDLFLSAGISCREKSFFRAAGARGIRQQIDRTLSQLGVDYLDLFYISDPQGDTAAEESLQALKREIDRGRILYGGIRDFNTSECQKRIDLMREMAIPPLVIRASYSLENRWVEQTLDHLMEMSGLNMIATDSLHRTEEQEETLKGLAQKRGQTVDQISIAWILHQPFVNSLLLPCRSEKFIQEACRARDNQAFSEEEIDQITNQ